ncbi:MAG: hypothetical protein MK135_16885, partial [Polyangiaceae bacterium]|nr:hypothetical protein [Polyangiaceae bacterium]
MSREFESSGGSSALDTGAPEASGGLGTGGGDDLGTDDGSGGIVDGSGGEMGELPADLDAPAIVEGLQDLFVQDLYDDWAAELEYHESAGPHGTGVKVYYSPKAAEAFNAGADSYPIGSAVIKELTWNSAKTGIYGWDAMVKVADEGLPTDWFWYELQGTPEEPLLEGAIDLHQPGIKDILSTLKKAPRMAECV